MLSAAGAGGTTIPLPVSLTLPTSVLFTTRLNRLIETASCKTKTSILHVSSGHKNLRAYQESDLDVSLARQLDIVIRQPRRIDHDGLDIETLSR